MACSVVLCSVVQWEFKNVVQVLGLVMMVKQAIMKLKKKVIIWVGFGGLIMFIGYQINHFPIDLLLLFNYYIYSKLGSWLELRDTAVLS